MSHARERAFRTVEHRSSRLRAALVLALLGALAGCGGGGGGGGSSTPPPAGAAYGLSRTSVAFTATQGDPAPASQQVVATVTTGTVYFLTMQTGSGFTHTFQLSGETTGTITIVPNSTATPGNFVGEISVRGCSMMNCLGGDVAGSPQIITVTYGVTPAPKLSVSPSSLLFTTSVGVAPAAQSVDLSIASGTGTWTSSFNYVGTIPGWLSVTPQFGAFPGTVTANVSPVATAGTYTASIEIASGGSTASVPVTLVVSEPRVTFVAPYVATAGRAGSVIIRGRGFAGIAAGMNVSFGGAAATAVTFAGDSEIRASHPALAAGSYDVIVGNGGPVLPTRAKLVVVAPPAYAPTTIVRAFNPSAAVISLIYDDERASIYVTDNDRKRIEAYRFTGAWFAEPAPFLSTPPTALNEAMALSPDGTEIVKPSNDRLWRVNPATLGAIGGVPTAPVITPPASLNFIAFANDGNAIGTANDFGGGTSLYRYDMLAQKLAALSNDATMVNREVFASRDGATLLIATAEPLRPDLAKPVFRYDAGSGSLTQLSVKTTNTHVTMDRTAARIILVSSKHFPADQTTTVYDGSFNALGTLPANQGAVISPDGTKAYLYVTATGTIRKFDLTSPVGGGFAEVGAGTPVLDAPGGLYLPMAISADGGTLFLAGDLEIAVLPAP